MSSFIRVFKICLEIVGQGNVGATGSVFNHSVPRLSAVGSVMRKSCGLDLDPRRQRESVPERQVI